MQLVFSMETVLHPFHVFNMRCCLRQKLTAAMGITVLVLVLLLLHYVDGNNHDTCPDEYTCGSKECVEAAAELLETMDDGEDPCDDFYQYACGGWMSRQFLGPHKRKVTTFESDQLLVLTRAMFLQDNFNLVDVVHMQLGIWRLGYTGNEPIIFNADRFLNKGTTLGVHPLFTLQADPESFTDSYKRNKPSNIYISKPVLTMPINLYESFSKFLPYLDIYARKIVQDFKVFPPLEPDLDFDPEVIFDPEVALQDAREIVSVEIKLAEIYNTLPTKGTTVRLTIEELNRDYGKLLNWEQFISNLVISPPANIRDITPREVVIVRDPEYLKKMVEYFAQLPNRTQCNYVFWRLFESFKYAHIEDSRKLNIILSGRVASLEPQILTELTCVKYTSEVFHFVVHRMLYQAHIPKEVRNEAKNIIEFLISRFRNLVSRHTWIDLKTANAIREKTNWLETIIAFHYEAEYTRFLKSHYSRLDIGTSFMKNMMEARTRAFAWDIKNIRRKDWDDPPLQPHQFVGEYYRTSNTLYISPMAFQKPFLKNTGLWSLMYAGFGVVMAQEVMKAFDTKGIRYIYNGRYGDWWSAAATQRYSERVQCLVDEYNNYIYSPAGMFVNGTLTLDSNIADHTGLRLAYQAYTLYTDQLFYPEKNLPGLSLSKEQLFFLKFAQLRCTVESPMSARAAMTKEHSPDKIRVNGPLRNFQAFADAFSCPVGSKMNPRNKCEV
ncbi:hypothetical protein BsWGS_17224 [Bradybaena similaris]